MELFFRRLVALHQNRILVRLGSTHAILTCIDAPKKRLRPKLIPQLYSAVQYSGEQAGPNPPAVEAIALEGAIVSLHELFCELEKLSTTDARSKTGLELIKKIVKGAHRVQSTRALQVLLGSLPDLAPDSSRKILTTVAKLSRYWTISKFLLKLASQSRLCQSVDVRTIRYEAQAAPATEPEAYIDRSINRVYNDERFKRKLTTRKLNSKKQIRAFVAREVSVKHPVHAEVQLLWYYETNACEIRPRVIGSSKKACFLCNLFFRLHGGYITPATHGRLYTKWGLPRTDNRKAHAAGLDGTVHGMIEVVKHKLEGELNSPQRPRPPPAESVIFPSAACSYTNRSDSVVNVGKGGGGPLGNGEVRSAEALIPTTGSGRHLSDAQSAIETEPKPTSAKRSLVAASSGSASEAYNEPGTSPSEVRNTTDSLSSDTDAGLPTKTSSTARATNGFPEDQRLERGVPVWRHMSATAPETSVSTPRLQIMLSYDIGNTQAPETLTAIGESEWPTDYWVEMLWCMQEVIEDFATVSVTDIQRMAHGAEVDIGFSKDEPRSLRVCYQGDTVTLTYHQQGPPPGHVDAARPGE